MRRLVLLCSAFAFAFAAVPADAQAQSTKPRAAAKKSSTAAKPETPPDIRPRYKRDDTPGAVAATPAKPAVATKKRSRLSRKPAESVTQPDTAAGATPATRPGPRDVLACAQSRDHEAAIAGCTRLIEDAKQKPKGRAVAYYNRGNAHAAKGDTDAAIADYDEAIRLDPKNANAYNNRGSAKNDKGDAEAAMEDFNAAIKQNGRYASAYFNRANARAARGESEPAMKDYDVALRYDGRNVNARIARGALLLASGATAKARADMRQAAAVDRKNAYALIWHEIAERRAKQKGVLAGGKRLKNVDMSGWPAPVLHMFVGELKADGVLAAADDANPARKEAHTCEANFYSGEYALIEGNRDEAVKLFQAAAKDCPRGFVEGIVAQAELKSLGEKN